MSPARTTDTDRFVRELVEKLRPVRRIPALRRPLGWTALLWLAGAGGLLAVKGLPPEVRDAVAASPASAAILTGLALVAIGGVGAALAESVPGRARLSRTSLAVGAAGVLVAIGTGAVLLLRGGDGLRPVDPVTADLACLSLACLLALPPALGTLLFAGRAAPFRPLLITLFAATGSVALGALIVHLSCDYVSARHLLVGHALAPMLGALLLTPPYHAALARLSRWPLEDASR